MAHVHGSGHAYQTMGYASYHRSPKRITRRSLAGWRHVFIEFGLPLEYLAEDRVLARNLRRF